MTTGKRFRLTNPKNAFQEMKCGINDRDKTLTFNEVVDSLNKQHEIINNTGKRIDDYLMEINYQIEQGTELKNTYVRYGRFKQILLELKGELE